MNSILNITYTKKLLTWHKSKWFLTLRINCSSWCIGWRARLLTLFAA